VGTTRRSQAVGSVVDMRANVGSSVKPPRPLLWGSLTSLGVIFAIFSLFADQLFKFWMLRVIDIATNQPIIVTPFLRLVLAWNQGVSYGWFAQGGDLRRLVLMAVSLIASLLLWVWLARTRSPLSAAGLGLIIGGAIGNLIDRTIYGAVADFFLFHALGFSWYIFNIADVAIVAGVLALLYDSVRENRRQKA
jgi:signal peptidase II